MQTRFAVGDVGRRQYDDFEIERAVDSAVTMLEGACVEYFSDLLISGATVNLKNGKGRLPVDFLAMAQVGNNLTLVPALETFAPPQGGYAVRGDDIYCECNDDKVHITYHKRPQKTRDGLDLPFNMLQPLAKLASTLLNGEFETAREEAISMALSSKRRPMGGLPDPAMWGA